METIDTQCQRLVEARDLMTYFIEFNSGNPDDLSAVFKDKTQVAKAAIIAKRLNTVAQDLDTPRAQTVCLHFWTLLRGLSVAGL